MFIMCVYTMIRIWQQTSTLQSLHSRQSTYFCFIIRTLGEQSSPQLFLDLHITFVLHLEKYFLLSLAITSKVMFKLSSTSSILVNWQNFPNSHCLYHSRCHQRILAYEKRFFSSMRMSFFTLLLFEVQNITHPQPLLIPYRWKLFANLEMNLLIYLQQFSGVMFENKMLHSPLPKEFRLLMPRIFPDT